MKQYSTSQIEFYHGLSWHPRYELHYGLTHENEYPLNTEHGTEIIEHKARVKELLEIYIGDINSYLTSLNPDDKIVPLQKFLEKATEEIKYWLKELRDCKKIVRDYANYRKTKDYEKDIKLSLADARYRETKEYKYKRNIGLKDRTAIAIINSTALKELTDQLNKLLVKVEIESEKYRQCINMVDWAYDFGLTGFLLEKSQNNYRRAARLLSSITGENAESIRKIMEAIHRQNPSNKRNSPRYKRYNFEYIEKMREEFPWTDKKWGNLK